MITIGSEIDEQADALRETLANRLSELAHVVRAFVTAEAAALGLSITQAQVLRAIAQQSPMTAGGLAERLDVDNSNITGVIDKLQDRGFVERRPHPGDRRSRLIVTTPSGRRAWRTLRRQFIDENPVINAIAAADQEHWCDLLEQILAPLRATPPGAADFAGLGDA